MLTGTREKSVAKINDWSKCGITLCGAHSKNLYCLHSMFISKVKLSVTEIRLHEYDIFSLTFASLIGAVLSMAILGLKRKKRGPHARNRY